MRPFIVMGIHVILGALLLWTGLASGREVCCKNGDCYDDSPPFDSFLFPLPMCPEVMEPLYLLYTRKNKDVPEEFDRFTVPPQFDGSQKTVLLVHGFNNDHTKGWLQRAKDALLTRVNYNVVVVGWGKGSSTLNYFKAVSNSRVISTEISYVLKNLYKAGAAPSRTWCVGHSLGAHVCGRAGKLNKYARITGLDPAGPVWNDIAYSAGLTKDDADFVDTIHSHGQGLVPLGTMMARGHLDFYPNDGGIQPGCFTYDMLHATRLLSLKQTSLKAHGRYGLPWGYADFDPNCSHSRAKEYFIESVADVCFKATSKCTSFKDIPGTCSPCSGAACPFMGFDAAPSDARGLYTLRTANSEPFCLS